MTEILLRHQVFDGVADVDEVVGDTFGVLRQGEVFRAHGGTARAFVQTADMVALHLFSQVVNAVLCMNVVFFSKSK